ncbi:MAG: hypothetical protein JWP05_99 [Microbacteriaceae bacterium]|nr:hypothetical protein [Microbacteriaceae bacterium]
MKLEPDTVRAPGAFNAHGALRTWWPVLLFLPARGVLSLLSQSITCLILVAAGNPRAWEASYGWWTVYGTFTDVCCIILLVVLLRREGLGLRDAFGITRANSWQQLRAAPIYLVVVFPAVAASSLITLPFYGPGAVPPQVASIHLPPWAAAYSIAIWPIVWAITEELVYLGFILPRLEVAFGNRWAAAAVTVFFWTGQHLVIPFIPDPSYLVSRWLGALMITGAMTVTFLLLRRRLLAATVVHWLSDAATAAAAVFFLAR